MKFALYACLLISVFGGGYILFLTYIDGTIFRPPIQYYADTQNFQTDKQVYQRGDTISIRTAFCFTRHTTSMSAWSLVDDVITYFPASPRKSLPTGCYGLDKPRYVQIATIPLNTVPGVHHLEGYSSIKVNELRSIIYNYKSQDFLIQ